MRLGRHTFLTHGIFKLWVYWGITITNLGKYVFIMPNYNNNVEQKVKCT